MQTGVGAKTELTAKEKGKADVNLRADADADADPLVGVFNRPRRAVMVTLTKPYYSKPGKPSTLNAL
jgi:hypothetical protein